MSRDAGMRAEIAALRLAVMELWDPIEVADSPEAADEYDSYLYAISRELRDGSIDSLAEHLRTIATEQMGLDCSPSDDRRAAEALFNWWTAHRRS